MGRVYIPVVPPKLKYSFHLKKITESPIKLTEISAYSSKGVFNNPYLEILSASIFPL